MSKKSTSKLFQEETAEVKEEEITESEATEEEVTEEATEEEETTEKVVEDDIQDIDLSVIKKQRFRINGDNSKILELNVSDMRIATRLKEAYPRLNALMDSISDKFSNISDVSDEDTLTQVGEAVDEIDKKMREEIDYIFDANVSEICGADGSMWDPIEGSFRYEHIIDNLSKLYENNLDKEFMEMKRRVETKTGKYAQLQDHKKKAK